METMIVKGNILISVINHYDLTMTPFKSVHTEVQISLSQTINLRNVNNCLHFAQFAPQND